MAVLSDQHWRDRALGLAEMLRIARRRVVALTFDERPREQFWLTRDYLTEYTVAAEQQRSEPVRAGCQRHGSDPSGARPS